MAWWNTLPFLFTVYFILKPLTSLISNYFSARKTGLRILISPITPYTVQWQLAATLFGPVLHRFHWFRAIDWTCAWQDDDALHEKLGRCFIVVSPGLNVLCTSDPKTIEHVLRKWRDFVKPDNVNEILGTFGQNVDTSNGSDWPRHRKITAPCFSERASSLVWSEALQQSEVMLTQWLSPPNKKDTSMIKDTSKLALNVISAVAFENHQVNTPTESHTMSLRDALVTVMSTSISPALESVMPWLKTSGLQALLPKSIKGLLVAMSEFRQYMDEMIARERGKPTTADGRLNLISTLTKANEPTEAENGETKARLSDVELRGNIFIFTVGGLESTSITLSYALALLAVHPEIQNWVSEEVNEMFGNGSGEVDYTKLFPKLKRVMAVMYETLRLYGPSPPLPRSSSTPNIPFTIPASAPQASSSKDSPTPTISTTLPGNTQIMLNSWACHTSSTHFPDPKVWNPKRWIQSQLSSPVRSVKTSNLSDASQTNEKLIHPTSESAFYAWGAGPRVCPGMKFSQVEFAAVMASVMRRVRVELVVEDGVEEWEEKGAWELMKEKVLRVLRDSVAEPLLLHVRRPEELCVRFVER